MLLCYSIVLTISSSYFSIHSFQTNSRMNKNSQNSCESSLDLLFCVETPSAFFFFAKQNNSNKKQSE